MRLLLLFALVHANCICLAQTFEQSKIINQDAVGSFSSAEFTKATQILTGHISEIQFVDQSAVNQSQRVDLTFHNGSLKSIPLVIPGVMNPNLSPMSNSGVTLDYGQKVFFKEKGKQYLLFEVDETFKNGDVLEIHELIKAKKNPTTPKS